MSKEKIEVVCEMGGLKLKTIFPASIGKSKEEMQRLCQLQVDTTIQSFVQRVLITGVKELYSKKEK